MIGDNDDETTTLRSVVFATVASISSVNENVSNCNHCQQQPVRTIETTAAQAATAQKEDVKKRKFVSITYHAQTNVSSLEVVVALAISPAITSPPATDTSSSSDCDHMVCHPHQNWIGISIDE